MRTKIKAIWSSPECRVDILTIAAGIIGLAVNINYYFG